MPARKNTEAKAEVASEVATEPAETPAAEKRTRVTVELPQSIRSEPGGIVKSKRGGGFSSANVELKKQLVEDVSPMELGDSRTYWLEGNTEDGEQEKGSPQQKSFVSLFRKVVDEVFQITDDETGEKVLDSEGNPVPAYGVQVGFTAENLTVKLTKRVKRTKKQATEAEAEATEAS